MLNIACLCITKYQYLYRDSNFCVPENITSFYHCETTLAVILKSIELYPMLKKMNLSQKLSEVIEFCVARIRFQKLDDLN